MKFGLSDDQLRQVQVILSKYPAITEVVVFGSRAMGNYKEASDVDVALKGNVTLSMVADVKCALEEDTYLPFFFDIIAYGIIDAPKLKEHIDKFGEVLYRAGWKQCKLSSIAEVQTGPFGSQLHLSDYKTSGTPIITVEHLGDNRIVHSNLPLVGEQDKERLKKYTLKKGDVVFSRVGSVDRCAFVHEDEDGWMFSGRLLRVRANENLVNSRFLSFYFSQESFKDTIRMIAVGATMPSINTGILSNVEILLPPLPEQRAISSVLSSLDDKIDLLHRQNKTLEGLASALWRKIFIEEAASTWKTGKLGDYGDFKNGINYSRDEKGDTEYSILNVRDIVESKYLTGNDFEKINVNESKATPYLLQTNDIVIVRSASPGESLIVLGEISNLLYSGFSIRLRCHNKQHALFVFQFLQSYKKQMDIFSDGTTLKNINQGILNGIDLIVPDSQVLLEFNAKAGDIYNKIMLNQRQVRNLAHLRDTLLPKLMSGEVRIKL